MQGLTKDIESLIFCSPEPVQVSEIVSCLRKLHGETVAERHVRDALEAICTRYREGDYPFEVVALAGGYRFLTKPDCKQAVSTLLQEQARKKLSAAALETLSIAAYRQPITKAEIEQVRGVNCDYAILKLLERGLLAIAGRKEAPGRPVIYQTTTKFLEHLGIASLRDLPPVRLPADTHELGEPDELALPQTLASDTQAVETEITAESNASAQD